MIRNIKRLLGPLAVALMLAACASSGEPPPDDTVIIPDTTKVADGATRASLTHFDLDSGVMRFADNTPLLQALRPDDVLVSEVSAAAPYGYLRKVKTIRQEGGEVVLETTQANLTDAIHQGELDGAEDLEAEDLSSATALVEGLSVGVVEPAAGVGDGFRFEARFDETVLDISEGDVKVKVRVNGVLYFNAGYNVGVGIKGCFELPPVCVDRFEAGIGFDQRAELQVSGEANAKITKEKRVAEYRFAPKCFAIGPVPVCVVPTVYVFVGASGEVNLKFNYAATQTAQARIGAKWTKKRGWEDIKPTPSFNTTFDQAFDINAGLKARAYAKAEGALMLYAVAGPTIGARMEIELDAAIPRDPIWILRGSLEAYYGFIVDLPVIGRLAESKGTLYTISREFGRSPNSPPEITLTSRANANVDMGLPLNLAPGCAGQLGAFFYTVSDKEQGCGVSVTVTSNVDGPLPFNHTFQTAGLRFLTVTARDNGGLSVSKAFTLAVINTPPVVYGVIGTDTVQATVPFYPVLSADDVNSGRLSCGAITLVGVRDFRVLDTQNGTCKYEATFAEQGQQTLTATARDPQGAVSTPKAFALFVSSPPAVPPPVWVIPPGLEVRDENGKLIANEEVVSRNCGATVTLSAQATDPGGKPVTYTWIASPQGQAPQVLTPDADGKVRASYSNTTGRVEFAVTASNGESSSSPLSQAVVFSGLCVK